MPSLSLKNGPSASSFVHHFLLSSLVTLLRGTVYNYKARYLKVISVAVIKCPDFEKKKQVRKGFVSVYNFGRQSPGASPGRNLTHLVTHISTVKSRRNGCMLVSLLTYFQLGFSILVQFRTIFLGNGTICDGLIIYTQINLRQSP